MKLILLIAIFLLLLNPAKPANPANPAFTHNDYDVYILEPQNRYDIEKERPFLEFEIDGNNIWDAENIGFDIERIDLGELESEVVRCDALLVGSPTINQNTLLPVYKLFAVINPLRDKGKLAATFGSYGWSGEAPGIISDNLKNLKLNLFDETAGFKFMPDEQNIIELVAFGTRFANTLADCV